MTRITARSRLHFGLLQPPRGGTTHWPGLDGGAGLPIRQFGGVGLMIDDQAIVVVASRSSEWKSMGALAERALAFGRKFVSTLPAECQSPFEIEVASCPSEHIGLGVGTALGLSVARAISTEAGLTFPSMELARRIGRGERSAIGVHGFDLGGLIVEGGKTPNEAISPLIAHHPWPADWQVSLHQPADADRWFGDRERTAFDRLKQLPEPSDAEVDRLCRLIVQGILPGIASGDLAVFGEAVYEYNARIGDLFAPVQGGRYTTPGIAAKIAELRGKGVKGVGQSSWGPTVFGIECRL